ncbi:uncharacterized protein LOC120142699 isoform X4 [Hibiscus syriacus]|uniref:uncharacterized protein LOC120142699 isoform X4 n=1 Tax=Hibiscus syriacus TaxID=106335 RepID=UPI001923642A|nr:uncharacterized protein LOC120142699 isoform X4 [Hibiscus syriacus]
MISVAGRLLSLLLDSGCWILPTIQCGDQLVPFWQIYQVLISTILLKLYVVYGWLLETSWDFQLVLVGVGIGTVRKMALKMVADKEKWEELQKLNLQKNLE